MGRKTIGILTILLLFALVAGWYYFTSESKYFNTPAFKAVPKNAAVIVRIQNLSDFSAKVSANFLSKEFPSLPGLPSVFNQLQVVDSVLSNDPASRKYLSDKSLTLAFGGEEGKKSLLYLVELSDMAEKTAIKNIFRDYFDKRNASSIVRKEGKISVNIYYWSSGPSRITFCIAFYKGIFIAGSDPDRVIEAAQLLDNPSFEDNSEFQKIAKTASPNADMNVYLNRQLIGKSVSTLFSRNFLQRINADKQHKSWSEIDCSLKENELLFNGFTVPADSLSDYLGVLVHQKPVPFYLDRHLPAETSFFLSLNLTDLSSYFTDYEEMLAKNGELDSYKIALTEVDTLYGVNLQRMIKENATGQAALVFTHYDQTTPLENRYLVIQIKREQHLDSLMLRLVSPVIPGKKTIFRGLTQEFKIGKDTLFKMHQIPVNNVGERVFGKIFSGVPTSCFTVCDSCLILGGSFKALEDYLQSVILKETLDKTLLYKEFTASLSQSASLYSWGIPSLCLPFFSSDIHTGFYRTLQSQSNKLQKINSFGWQMSSDEGMIYNIGRVSYSPVPLNKPLAIWKFLPDSTIISKPYLVSNPENKDKAEVMVQDKNNTLYLISNSGVLLWKKKLSGPLLSQIFQINYFHDKRIQYLFNTPDAIHLIDREGNYIPGFPVMLKSRATNGIGVFDYDHTRDYRIFIACENKNIYAFDRNGVQITGWQAAPFENRVTNPVQFFRVLNKDYLVFADGVRIYILDRKGNPRVVLQQEIVPSLNNGFTLEDASTGTPARLVTTDQQGNVCMINFDGSVKRIPLGKFSVQHYFLDADLDLDGKMEYILLDENILNVYTAEGKLIFTRNFPNKINQAVQLFTIKDKRKYLGIADLTANQLYLINSQGSDYAGFPIEGNTPFTVGVLNPDNIRFNLLAGSLDGYFNNYSLK